MCPTTNANSRRRVKDHHRSRSAVTRELDSSFTRESWDDSCAARGAYARKVPKRYFDIIKVEKIYIGEYFVTAKRQRQLKLNRLSYLYHLTFLILLQRRLDALRAFTIETWFHVGR